MNNNTNDGLRIDLGIKDLAVVSNAEKPFRNINKTRKVKKLEKKLKREQRKLSRKYESLKIRNKKEGGNATRQNIQKQVVNEIIKTKPSYTTIEDLGIIKLIYVCTDG